MAPAATTNGNTVYADGRQGKRIENYAAFWQKDLSKEQGQDTENRLANYTDVINGECLSSSWRRLECAALAVPAASGTGCRLRCWLFTAHGIRDAG